MLKQSRNFPCCQEHSVLSSPNFNRTKKATTFRFASFSALSTCVESKQNTRWSWWPIRTPYHAFYTTVRNLRYQSISAAVQATQDKQYCVTNHLYINLRVEHATMAMATARWAVARDLTGYDDWIRRRWRRQWRRTKTTMRSMAAGDNDDD